MFRNTIIVAGSGGQGALRVGQMIAYAAINEGNEATWLPSYGAEMRGGTANCSVVLSTERVGSPVFARPSELIVLNLPSLLKFQDDVQPGGTIFVNSSVIEDKVARQDVTAYYVPCSEIAEKVGNPKASNMVMLGAYVAATKVVKPETVVEIIKEMFTGAKAKFVPANIAAFQGGMECVK